jgi:hypothetical protein
VTGSSEAAVAITYRVMHDRRLVETTITGMLDGEELMRYQAEVWSRDDVAGYDELVDVRGIERVDSASADGMRDLARLSAGMKGSAAGRLAIVAPQDITFGLGRQYEAIRDLTGDKRVAVFRGREEALAWLGVAGGPEPA